MDQDPYWECGSGSSSKKIDRNNRVNLISCLSKRLLYLRKNVLWSISYIKYFFIWIGIRSTRACIDFTPWNRIRTEVPTKLDPDPHWNQSAESRSGGFWASRIQILPSSSKNSKKTPDFYYFVTSLWLFICKEWFKCTFKKNYCVHLEGHWQKEQDADPDPLVRGIWIRGSGSGSLPKCHGSWTLTETNADPQNWPQKAYLQEKSPNK